MSGLRCGDAGSATSLKRHGRRAGPWSGPPQDYLMTGRARDQWLAGSTVPDLPLQLPPVQRLPSKDYLRAGLPLVRGCGSRRAAFPRGVGSCPPSKDYPRAGLPPMPHQPRQLQPSKDYLRAGVAAGGAFRPERPLLVDTGTPSPIAQVLFQPMARIKSQTPLDFLFQLPSQI